MKKADLKTLREKLVARLDQPFRVRAERKAARKDSMERKAATRHKIQLGGLVVKAGLGAEPPAVLLGILLEAARRLQADDGPATRTTWDLVGARCLAETPPPP